MYRINSAQKLKKITKKKLLALRWCWCLMLWCFLRASCFQHHIISCVFAAFLHILRRRRSCCFFPLLLLFLHCKCVFFLFGLLFFGKMPIRFLLAGVASERRTGHQPQQQQRRNEGIVEKSCSRVYHFSTRSKNEKGIKRQEHIAHYHHRQCHHSGIIIIAL